MQVRGFASAYSARGLVGEYSVAVQRKLRGSSGESQRVLQSAKPTQAEQGVPVCRWMTARPLLNMPYPGILFCVGMCAWRALFLRLPHLRPLTQRSSFNWCACKLTLVPNGTCTQLALFAEKMEEHTVKRIKNQTIWDDRWVQWQ